MSQRPPEKFVISTASVPQVIEGVIKHIHDNQHVLRQMLHAADPRRDIPTLDWLKLSIKEIRARIDQSYGDPSKLKQYYECLKAANTHLAEFGKSLADIEKAETYVDISEFDE